MSVVASTTQRWTVVEPPASPWSVAMAAEVATRSMPGVTTTLFVPEAIVAIPTELSK